MRVIEKDFKGVYEIDLDPKGDDRGFFMRTFDRSIFESYQLNRDWVQENHSRSDKKGIIRGLHFQFPPRAETKLVRCIRGAVWDVFVDLRQGSNTFAQWGATELSEANKKMIFIPRGFAHGFCTLSKRSEILYKVDNYYAPDHESGLLWNDESLQIPWPVKDPILSKKDQQNLSLEQFIKTYKAISV